MIKVFALIFLLGSECFQQAGLDDRNGYEIVEVVENEFNLTISLRYILHENEDTIYPNVIKRPLFILYYQTKTEFDIKIIDQDNQRWEIPKEYPFPHDDPAKRVSASSIKEYVVTYKDKPFSFTVRRNSTNETIFSTEGDPLILSNNYLEITNSKVPTANIYGLGESNSYLRMRSGIHTLWCVDNFLILDKGF